MKITNQHMHIQIDVILIKLKCEHSIVKELLGVVPYADSSRICLPFSIIQLKKQVVEGWKRRLVQSSLIREINHFYMYVMRFRFQWKARGMND